MVSPHGYSYFCMKVASDLGLIGGFRRVLRLGLIGGFRRVLQIPSTTYNWLVTN